MCAVTDSNVGCQIDICIFYGIRRYIAEKDLQLIMGLGLLLERDTMYGIRRYIAEKDLQLIMGLGLSQKEPLNMGLGTILRKKTCT